MHHRASGLCAMGWHRPDPVARWNDGYYFTRCLRCGEDLVRTAYSGWQVPKGYKVVWQGKPPPGRPSADLVPAQQEPASAPPAAAGLAPTGEGLRHLDAETLGDAPPGLAPASSDDMPAPPAAGDPASELAHRNPAPAAQPIAHAWREPAHDDHAAGLNGSTSKTETELPVMALLREIQGGQESGRGPPAELSEGGSGGGQGGEPSPEQRAAPEAAVQADAERAEPQANLEADVAAQLEQRPQAEAASASEAAIEAAGAMEAEREPQLQAPGSEPGPASEGEQAPGAEVERGNELGSTEEQGELPGMALADTARAQPAAEMRETGAPEAEQHGQPQGELLDMGAPETEQHNQPEGELHDTDTADTEQHNQPEGEFRQADAFENEQSGESQSSRADDEAAAEQQPDAAQSVTAESENSPEADGTGVAEPAPAMSSLFDDFMEEDPDTDAWSDLASTPLPERPQPPQAPPEPAPQLKQAAAAAAPADPVAADVEKSLRPEADETRSSGGPPPIQQQVDSAAEMAPAAPAPSEQRSSVNEFAVPPSVPNLVQGSDAPLQDSSGDDVIEVYRGLKIAPGNAEQVRQADFMEETPSAPESAGGAKQPRWWVAGPVAGSLAVLVLVAFFSGGRGTEPAIGSGASRSATTAAAAREATPRPPIRQADPQSPLAQAAVNQPIQQAPAPAQPRETAFVAASFLQCRSAPVRQAPAVRKLARGDALEVLTRIPEWASVSHRGRQCWVSDRFLSPVEPL